MTDDPRIGPFSDGTGPEEEGRTPDAPRPHGGVDDPEHPEFFQASHRNLPVPEDDVVHEPRNLVVDDQESRSG
jgi:hypothetical protein